MARETQSSPAGEKKLEQYGVWVKVKPREVVPAPALEESFELSDLEATKGTATARRSSCPCAAGANPRGAASAGAAHSAHGTTARAARAGAA